MSRSVEVDRVARDRLAALLAGMTEYLRGDFHDGDGPFDAGHTAADIERCSAIMDDYLAAVGRLDDPVQIRATVKRVVLDLNALNASCGDSLIETEEREQLCELIITTAHAAGLPDNGEDPTFEWREW